MDKALNFSEHISSKINKANRNLGLIFRTFTYMDKEMFLNLYKSIVLPHVEYMRYCVYASLQERYGCHRKRTKESHKISPNAKSPNIPRKA